MSPVAVAAVRGGAPLAPLPSREAPGVPPACSLPRPRGARAPRRRAGVGSNRLSFAGRRPPPDRRGVFLAALAALDASQRRRGRGRRRGRAAAGARELAARARDAPHDRARAWPRRLRPGQLLRRHRRAGLAGGLERRAHEHVRGRGRGGPLRAPLQRRPGHRPGGRPAGARAAHTLAGRDRLLAGSQPRPAGPGPVRGPPAREPVRGGGRLPPAALAACARSLERPPNRVDLSHYVNRLCTMYRARQQRLPALYEHGRELGSRTIWEFDERVTAYYGGFRARRTTTRVRAPAPGCPESTAPR
jgi:hypothetical protein